MKFKQFPLDRQLDRMDCGPACLKMIAKYHGKFYSLQYIRDKCGITKEGVSLDLSYAAEAIGLRSLSIKATKIYMKNTIPLHRTLGK
ncbi:cysteine peptidase family C39 domain-containing protein [Mucilaginibacter antarcticus]|uniref:cysteine peptidase family C39 domain-containing protein n=1 Tax=Mucilaginibacter antarcticus TaxID=1855725 RepID=UPI0036269BFA